MKAIEQSFLVVLFKVALTLESVDAILKWHVIVQMNPSRGTVYYAIQCDYNFLVCGTNSRVWPFKWKLLYWRWQLHLTPYTSHLCKKLLCSSTGLHIMQGIVGILDHTMPERTQAKLHHGSVVENLKATREKEVWDMFPDLPTVLFLILCSHRKSCLIFFVQWTLFLMTFHDPHIQWNLY